jgi:serine/threonine protein phosphatase PrpC
VTIALRYALRSDVGLVRSNNQDAGFAGPNLLVVADGMGGHAGGDIASSIAVANLATLNDDSFGTDDAINELEQAIDRARDELVALSAENPELSGMGTTITAMLRVGSKLAMAHMGDSRAYLLRDGELTQITTDHTFVQHLVNTGKITAEEAHVHPQRNVVMRVLTDFGLDLAPDVSMREARPGDRLLLCSDGLCGYVSESTMGQALRDVADPDACTDRLVQLALRAGGPDNITCLVADVLDLDDLPDDVEPSSAVQIAGSAAVDRDRPTVATDGPAARAAILVRSADEPQPADEELPADADGDVDEDEDDDDARQPRRRRRGLRIVTSVVVLLAVVAGLGWLGYRWTQEQYYVGIADNTVAIFRGIPQQAGPFSLSTEVERTDIDIATLDEFVVDRLEQTLPEDSLTAARTRALGLAASATPTPTPADGTVGD